MKAIKLVSKLLSENLQAEPSKPILKAYWFAGRMAAMLKQFSDIAASSAHEAEAVASVAAFIFIWCEAYALWLNTEHAVCTAEKEHKDSVVDAIEKKHLASILNGDLQLHQSADSSQKIQLCKTSLSAMAFLVYSYFRCKHSGQVSIKLLLSQMKADDIPGTCRTQSDGRLETRHEEASCQSRRLSWHTAPATVHQRQSVAHVSGLGFRRRRYCS